MKLLILDGTTDESPVVQCIQQAAPRAGATVTHFNLAGSQLAPCLGDFECWTKTPGLCRTRDDAQDVARAVHDADLVVFLTPIVFGGYSSILKRAVDRLIPLIDSFFHQRAGLTRHLPRYDKYPSLLCIGLADAPDEESQHIFAELGSGNAINLQSPSFRSLIVSLRNSHWQEQVTAAIRSGLRGQSGEPRSTPPGDALARACAADPATAFAVAPATASILIGSARPKGQSTSESLARKLAKELEARGVKTNLVPVIHFVKPGHRAEKAMSTLLGSELLIIATPLYVDALPGLTTQALEWLADELRSQPHAVKRLVGLLNNGFPEAVHNRTALRILRKFAHQSGLHWAGGLAMGGGEILHGKPLDSARFLMRAQIRALKGAAAELAAGRNIPPESSRLMARALVPAFLFRWIAPFKWLLEAKEHGVGWDQLHNRPLDHPPVNSYSEIAGFGRGHSIWSAKDQARIARGN